MARMNHSPRLRIALAGATLSAALLLSVPAAYAGPREEGRIAEATAVVEQMQAMPDQRIPDWLLQRAQGIAVIPNVIKVGLGIGGRGGKGVLVVRRPDGSWSNPSFITLAGGSFGWQAGVQASDIVLVFTTRKSVEGITGGKFTLGADASVAVGPVGRQVSGATDVTLDAEVYSYSRAKGFFGGIAIDGTVMSIDHRANAAFYQRGGVLASDIFAGSAPAAPASGQKLVGALARVASGAPAPSGGATATAAAPAAPQGPAQGPAPAPANEERGLESGGATTFPLEEAPKNEGPR
jgi:lipid-binding SYLF domain-containing protein